MRYAAITGWGHCMPPAVLSNADLATFLDTSDEWIAQRTGIHERRVSHVTGLELAKVASLRALACAGIKGADLDLIVYGSCSNDEHIPNSASGLSVLLEAGSAAAMDVNTACTSFLHGLSAANAMIRTGVVRNALIVGVEMISPFMDWRNRNVAVLFGDGCAAVVLQASDGESGVLAEKLGCYAESRGILRVRGSGLAYAYAGDVTYGDTLWDFDGQEIFKRAVLGMSEASAEALRRSGKSTADIDLVVPHQANLRIIEFVAKRADIPMERVFVTVHKYGNMSAATVPVALVEALEAGRVKPRSLILTPGLRRRAHLLLARHPLGRSRDAHRRQRRATAAVRAQRARDRERHHEAARPARKVRSGSGVAGVPGKLIGTLTVPSRLLAVLVCVALAVPACERAPAPRAGSAPMDYAAFEARIRQYDRDVLAALRRLPADALAPAERAAAERGTTLSDPAKAADLEGLEKRIGKPLPPSYRAFLAATNGMMFEGMVSQVEMRPAAKVVPFSERDFPGIAIWLSMPDIAVPLVPEAGGPLPGAALTRAWVISSDDDGDVYFIFPDLASPDGEWTVGFFGPKNPGAYVYASFREMFDRESAAGLRGLELRRRR